MLTPREIEMVERIRDGKTNKVIGMELNITETTVKNRLTRVFQELRASDRAQAVVEAIRQGYITIDGTKPVWYW